MFSTLAIALLALLAIPPVAAQILKGRNISITGTAGGYTVKDSESSAMTNLKVKQQRAADKFGDVHWGPIVTNTVTTPRSWFFRAWSTTTLECKSLN